MKNLKSFVKFASALSVATATVFSIAQPAKAVIFAFEFTDEDGSGAGRVPNGIVKGELHFDSLTSGSIPDGNYFPDSILVTEIPSWADNIWGDTTGFQVNEPLSGLTNQGSFTFVNNEIVAANPTTTYRYGCFGCDDYERVELVTTVSGANRVFLQDLSDGGGLKDNDSSSLAFSEASASVPFEFSPTLGLLLMGGVFGISRYAKSRKASKLINNG